MNWDVLKSYWDYVPWALEKPAEWLAAAVAYAPKTSLVIALAIIIKLRFF